MAAQLLGAVLMTFGTVPVRGALRMVGSTLARARKRARFERLLTDPRLEMGHDEYGLLCLKRCGLRPVNEDTGPQLERLGD